MVDAFQGEIGPAIGLPSNGALHVASFNEIPKNSRLFGLSEQSQGYTDSTLKEVLESKSVLSCLKFSRNGVAFENGAFWERAEVANNDPRLSIADLIGRVTSDPIIEELNVIYGDKGSEIQTIAVQMKDPTSEEAVSVIYDKSRKPAVPGIEGWPERVVLVRHTKEGMQILEVSKTVDEKSVPTFEFSGFVRKSLPDGKFTDSIIDTDKFIEWTKQMNGRLEPLLNKRRKYSPSECAKNI